MYGESVFTTMRMLNSQIQDWDLHFERLRQGVDFVYGPFIDDHDWVPLLKSRLEERCSLESGNRVLRLTLYREQIRGILKLPVFSVMDLKIQLQATTFDPSSLVASGLKLRTCPVIAKPEWWPSFLKAGNYLSTILAQKIYLRSDDDDLLFLSEQDTVLESSVANIFVVYNNKLYTAPPGPNVLEGVMRKKVMQLAFDFFENCFEVAPTLDQVFHAEAVFGTNSIRGLFLIDRVDGHQIEYESEMRDKLSAIASRIQE
jgi:branched-subunit amino acid aminotransferase/4-amino-4-deoxychorismate lyase